MPSNIQKATLTGDDMAKIAYKLVLSQWTESKLVVIMSACGQMQWQHRGSDEANEKQPNIYSAYTRPAALYNLSSGSSELMVIVAGYVNIHCLR